MKNLWYARSGYNLLHDCACYGFSIYILKSESLCPFCKIIRHYKYMAIPFVRLRQLAQYIRCNSFHWSTGTSSLHRSSLLQIWILAHGPFVTTGNVLIDIFPKPRPVILLPYFGQSLRNTYPDVWMSWHMLSTLRRYSLGIIAWNISLPEGSSIHFRIHSLSFIKLIPEWFHHKPLLRYLRVTRSFPTVNPRTN